jgi:uncharacterized protein
VTTSPRHENSHLPTSRDPIEVVEAIYAAMDAGDHNGTRELLAPDLRWRQAGSVVPAAGEDAVGAEALIERVIQPLERVWEGFSEHVDEMAAIGERVVATGEYHGRNRATGTDLRVEFCHLWEVRDGVVVSFRQFTDTATFAAALESV